MSNSRRVRAEPNASETGVVQIVAAIPSGATSGPVAVYVGKRMEKGDSLNCAVFCVQYRGDAATKAMCVARLGMPHNVVWTGAKSSPQTRIGARICGFSKRISVTRQPVILGYCLMSNHVHLIAVPAREDSLSVLLRRVHGRYAQYYNALSGRSGHLWQNRFFACVLGPRLALSGLSPLSWLHESRHD